MGPPCFLKKMNYSWGFLALSATFRPNKPGSGGGGGGGGGGKGTPERCRDRTRRAGDTPGATPLLERC